MPSPHAKMKILLILAKNLQKMGYTKLCNKPQQATWNHNDPHQPQQPTTTHNEPQWVTVSHNDPQQAITSHNDPQQACSAYRRLLAAGTHTKFRHHSVCGGTIWRRFCARNITNLAVNELKSKYKFAAKSFLCVFFIPFLHLKI